MKNRVKRMWVDAYGGRLCRGQSSRRESTEGSVAFLKGLRKTRSTCSTVISGLSFLPRAAVQFADQNLSIMELDGGWRWWKDDGFDVESEVGLCDRFRYRAADRMVR